MAELQEMLENYHCCRNSGRQFAAMVCMLGYADFEGDPVTVAVKTKYDIDSSIALMRNAAYRMDYDYTEITRKGPTTLEIGKRLFEFEVIWHIDHHIDFGLEVNL